MTTCGQYDMVRISDQAGQDVLRYLKLCDGRFFGGNTWSRVDGFAAGIHEILGLGAMLDLIAKIANTPGPVYDLDSFKAYRIPIRREMNAHQIAGILGCDEQEVRGHFEPLISLAGEVMPSG